MLRKMAVGLACFVGAGLFILLVTGVGGAADDKVTGSAVTAEEAAELVKLHNDARKEVGVPPVKWSPTLAKHAQAYADELARTGKWEHNPDDKYGENLASGSGGGYNVLSAVQGWYDEKARYTPGTPYPGVGYGVGHYTQMVWKKTTEIGVGKAVYTTGEYKGALIIVANYDPPGNFRGEKPY
jgi:pathogenesis-related protein 1